MYLAVIFLCEQILLSQVKADVTAEGSMIVSSEDMSGDSTEEGTGLTGGTLRFGGQAHASGAVTIIGSTAQSHLPSLPEPFIPPPPLFTTTFSPTFLVPTVSPIIISPTFFVPALAPALPPKLALALAEILVPTLTSTLAPALAPALPPARAIPWFPVFPPFGLTIETVLAPVVSESTSLELADSETIPVVTTSDAYLEDHEGDIKSNIVPVASSVPFAAMVPIASAQIVGVNSPNQFDTANQNARLATNGGGISRGFANGMPTANQMARYMAGNNLPNTGNMNMNIANMNSLAKANFPGMGIPANFANQNLMSSNLAAMNLARENLPSNTGNPARMNPSGGILLNSNNIANTLSNPNLANIAASTNLANQNMAAMNNLATSNLIQTNPASANVEYPNFPNVPFNNNMNLVGSLNPNLGKLYIGGDTGLVSNSVPGQFGIHILADALEVGGTVAITGKMPIYGTVALTGHLPTDGAAAVSYNCA